MKTRDKILLIIAVLMFIVIIILTAVLFFVKPAEKVTNFDECAKVNGGIVMESYPRRCSYNGQTFTEVIKDDYYGTSYYNLCKTNADCREMGCNSEICGGANDEEKLSVCIKPSKSTPKELGYKCGCIEQKCQWGK